MESSSSTDNNNNIEISKSSSSYWSNRVLFPTIFGGAVGAGAGLVSKHRTSVGAKTMAATYAANLAICTGCYCAAREFVKFSRRSGPDDLLDSAIAGFGSGAILGRLQAGPVGAVRYSFAFACVGTAVDFAAIKVRPVLKRSYESLKGLKDGGFKLPEWSPIQVLDEEQLAAKREREQKLHAQINMNKEG